MVLLVSGRYYYLLYPCRFVCPSSTRCKQKMARFGLLRKALFHYHQLDHHNLIPERHGKLWRVGFHSTVQGMWCLSSLSLTGRPGRKGSSGVTARAARGKRSPFTRTVLQNTPAIDMNLSSIELNAIELKILSNCSTENECYLFYARTKNALISLQKFFLDGTICN